MKRSPHWKYKLVFCCLLPLLLAGCAGKDEAAPSPSPAIESATPHVVMIAATPEPTPTPTPEPTPEPVDHLGQRVRDNLMTDIETLKLLPGDVDP